MYGVSLLLKRDSFRQTSTIGFKDTTLSPKAKQKSLDYTNRSIYFNNLQSYGEKNTQIYVAAQVGFFLVWLDLNVYLKRLLEIRSESGFSYFEKIELET